VPSRQWKLDRMHEKWYAGETVSVAIGQGAVAVTPASLAVYMSALANGGTRVTPHLLKAVDDGSGWKPVPVAPPKPTAGLDPEKLEAIRDGMWEVVNEVHGTGIAARVAGHDIMGKTGSAQVVSLEKHAAVSSKKIRELRDHGWFVFAAPREKPTIAGVVFLEHGIHGGNAARLAHHILETYFAKLDGRPLPPPPTGDSMKFDFGGADR
jgi:penicillin-binding protein 2